MSYPTLSAFFCVAFIRLCCTPWFLVEDYLRSVSMDTLIARSVCRYR